MSRSTRLTCTPRRARNSGDARSLALGQPTREACPVPHQPRRARGSRAVNRPKLCCVGDSTIGNAAFPTGRRQHASSQMRLRARRGTQHSSSRNIGRQLDRAVRDVAPGKAIASGGADGRLLVGDRSSARSIWLSQTIEADPARWIRGTRVLWVVGVECMLAARLDLGCAARPGVHGVSVSHA
jgi:hypothetical protein